MANPFEMQVADPLGAQQEWRQTLARTASMEATAAAQKSDLASNQEFQAVLKTVSPNLPVMSQLGQIAGAAIKTGRFSEAEKAIQVMSTLENRDSMAEQRQARILQANAAVAKTRMDRQLELYAGVSDSETKRVADELYEKEFGQPSSLAQYPYSPKLVEMARQTQVKQLDNLTAALRQAQAATIAADDARQSAVARAQIDYFNARVDAVRVKTAAGTKASGKLAEPKPNEVKAVEAKLLVEYPDLEPAEFDLATREIAADAKEIQLREHGSFTDAMDKALAARKGQFTRMPGMEILGIRVGKSKTSYASSNKLQPLPEDRTKLRKGQLYDTKNGPARFNGTGFVAEPTGEDDGD